MVKFTLIRLVIVLVVCATSAGLLFLLSDRTVLGLAATAAAFVAIPGMLAGSFLWGPTGLAARLNRQGTYRFKSINRSAMFGIIIISIGLIAYAHFAFSPAAGFLGFLMVAFIIEILLLSVEFRRISTQD